MSFTSGYVDIVTTNTLDSSLFAEVALHEQPARWKNELDSSSGSISVIIPTWNEESWLPRLLERLGQLHDLIEEVIVADNGSSDATRQIARDYGCRVVAGGTPGKARNIGASTANGNSFVFVDADTLVSRDVLKLVNHYLARPGVVAVHFNVVPITTKRFTKFCYWVMSGYFRFVSKVGFPQGVGSFIAVKKQAFKRIGGFNEGMVAGEDLELFRHLRKIGRVIFDSSTPIYVSPRRFSIEHPAIFALKCCTLAILCRLGLLNTKANVVAYHWHEYPSVLAQEEELLIEPSLRDAHRG